MTDFRCDSFPIPKYQERPDGYLSLMMPIAREGELRYLNADGSERLEYVAADTLKKSAHTFTNQPITLGHPSGRVTPANIKALAVGMTGRLAHLDDRGVLWVDGTVTDAAAIDSIKSGKTRQLSCGYEVKVFDRGDGKFEQVERIGNHTALVSRARGGPDLSIRIDGAEVPQADCDCEFDESEIPEAVRRSAAEPTLSPVVKTSKRRKDTGEKRKSMQILINGKLMRVDAEDPATLDAIQAEAASITERADKAEAELNAVKLKLDVATASTESLTKERDGLQARIDAAEAEPEAATETKSDSSDIKTRIAVIREVSPFMAKAIGSSFNEDSLYELTPHEIKLAYLATKNPSMKERLDSASEDYVEAFYDAQKPEAAAATAASGNRVDSILGRISGTAADPTTQMNADAGMPAALLEARKKRAERVKANGQMSMLKKGS